MAKAKVDLELLKNLVSELEVIVTAAEASKEEKGVKPYVVEMSKAVGLATSTMLEATALIADIQTAIGQAQGPAPSKEDPLAKLFGKLGDPNKN